MLQRLLLSVPLALAWIALTGIFSLESFVVGLVSSVLVTALIFPTLRVRHHRELRLWDRTSAAVQYTVILFRDIYLSAIDVARRVIDPNMPLKPGIIAIPTDYTPPADSVGLADVVAAVSAHGITITPGELVIGFEGNTVMYVHCLDVDASSANGAGNQAKRLALLRRILE